MRNPIEMTDKHKLESKGLTLESSFIESDPTKALVLVHRVDLTGSRLKAPQPVVKFSKREHALSNPKATSIQLATPRYYRDYEENEGPKGIRDEKEAQYVIRTDLKTFFGKGKISGPRGGVGQGSVALAFTVDDFWMFCTAAKPKTDWELRQMLKESGYDCATTIANPAEFAKELGAAFAAHSRWSDVSLSGLDEVSRRLRPPEIGDKVVWVYHGPVVYQRNPAEMIEAFPEHTRGVVVPFVKREKFSHQREYRFTVLINGKPKEPTFSLPISTELRHLAKFDT